MEYYVLANDGNEYGPADIPTLRAWVQEGRIEGSTRLKTALDGTIVYASSLPEIFDVKAPVTAYPQQFQPMESGISSGFIVWTFVEAALGIVVFFVLHGIGLIFSGFAVYNAVRLVMAKHKLGVPALAFSIVCLVTVIMGWLGFMGGTR